MGFWRKILSLARYVPVTALFADTCYFALKPYSSIAASPLVPAWLGPWLDHHDFLVNMGGYALLTAAVHATFGGWRRKGVGAVWGRVLLLAALVSGLEFAQHFIPRRFFDWQDIMAGLLGVALATAPWVNLVARAFPSPEMPALAGIKK